jgi:FAD/FMN-containing dehydrogenase
MSPEHASALASLLSDESRVVTHPQIVGRLSRDFYWYSPVLRKHLDGKVGDLVVQPVHAAEVQQVLRYCHRHDIPVTTRGAGTGNYGQAVPLYGGVVLDLARMDRIVKIEPAGVAVCEPGVRLGALETEARKVGWELRCYPSTIVKASVGGFLGGGSGGIGSVAHGGLRDFNTVRALEVVTMEAEPRVIRREGEAVHDILHAWGTNGVITRIWLALAPAMEWSQCVVAFDRFDEILSDTAKSQYFDVSREGKESARQHRALNNYAWDRLEWLAGLRAERRRAFKAHETEQRQHKSETKSAAGHVLQTKLLPVKMGTVLHEQNDDQNGDQ